MHVCVRFVIGIRRVGASSAQSPLPRSSLSISFRVPNDLGHTAMSRGVLTHALNHRVTT